MPARANSNWVTSWPGLPARSVRSAGQSGARRSAETLPLSSGLIGRGCVTAKLRASIQASRTGLSPRGEIDRDVAFGVGAGGIVDPDRRLVRIGERDLAERDADVGAAARRSVDFARARDRPGGHGLRRGEFGNLVHGRLLAHQVRRRDSGGPNRKSRPLRPFAGMTRIRFKGFGSSPSQPRSGRPSSTINVVPAARTVNTPRLTLSAKGWTRA